MIAVDTNILVYAHRRDSEWHDVASRAMTELTQGTMPWCLPWPCVHEFLGIVTHPRVYRPPTPLARAIAQVDAWFESQSVQPIGELKGHWRELCAVLSAGRVVGPAVHDARIAAICRENGVREIWTVDRDFSRMKGITVRNPLVG
jgi:hypothetical protein